MQTSSLATFLNRQHGLVTRRQALTYMSDEVLVGRLRRGWQRVMPGIYAAQQDALTAEQRETAAVLYAGETAQLTECAALARFGIRYLPTCDAVGVVIDWSVRRQSRGFVRVVRTRYLPEPLHVGAVRVAPPARALVDFASVHRDLGTVRAVWADAVQRRVVPLPDLVAACAHAPRDGRALGGRVLGELRDGVRSAPEAEFRDIALSCADVPRPLFNPLLELPNGRRISPDALIEDAGLVHETNGRGAHAEEDLFDSMQERHDVMTTPGLTVLHNSPRLLRVRGGLVRDEWRDCYRRLAGTGLPPGVRILRRTAA